MKAIEWYFPGFFVDGISHETLMKFAKNHGDNYIIGIGDIPGREEEVYKTIVRVLRKETGLHFVLVDTQDGKCVVYLPDCFGDCPTYKELCQITSHYLFELGSPSFQSIYFNLTECID